MQVYSYFTSTWFLKKMTVFNKINIKAHAIATDIGKA